MEIYIYNTDLDLLGVIDRMESFTWTRRYWNVGEFRLVVPFTVEHIDLLQNRNIIIKQGDEEAAQILYVNIYSDSKGQEIIEAQGKMLLNWLGKRIVLRALTTTNTTQNIINNLVGNNVTATSDQARRIPNLQFVSTGNTTDNIKIEYASEPYVNVLIASEEAAKAAKLGIRISTDVAKKQHTFRVYKGNDYTADQSAYPPCIFSMEFENILEQEFVHSIENYKNTAYVGGEEKEGVARKIVEVGNGYSGLDREEIFVNASDIPQTYQENDEQITLTNAEYQKLLSQKGASELELYPEALSFVSRINNDGNLEYKVDFDIGDQVTCMNKQWGVKINVRITEITETYDEEGLRIDVEFGENLPTLSEQIRRAV